MITSASQGHYNYNLAFDTLTSITSLSITHSVLLFAEIILERVVSKKTQEQHLQVSAG